MDQLIDALELVLLRVRCGETLSQALHALPELRAPRELCRLWVRLRDRMLDGGIPTEGTLESLLQHLILKQRIGNLLAQKTLNARLQAQVIAGLGVLVGIVAYCLFPEELQPPPLLLLGSAALLAAGTLWIFRLIHRTESTLWFADWLVLLSRLKSALAWGQALGPALEGALVDHPPASFPPRVQAALAQTLQACRQFEAAPSEIFAAHPADSAEVIRALGQLQRLHDLHFRGQPLSETLRTLVERALDGLERKLTREAEKLSFKLLLPLFTCHLPALGALLVGPLILSLMNS
ncbi:MAG: hypothetical protein JST16_12640 [Bdellovibrionales bacterium]|nr:hypothetical protein [Bdellovibrionales bacterium]